MAGGTQVHCLLDCLACALGSRGGGPDVRPLYFGVWDSPFGTDPDGMIRYDSPDCTGEAERGLLRELYGIDLTSLHNFNIGKVDNYRLLLGRLRRMPADRPLILLVDLYHLPYEHGCYRTAHRHHYILVAPLGGERFRIIDPYFSREAVVEEPALRDAYLDKELFACFALPDDLPGDIRAAPSRSAAGRAFERTLGRGGNPLALAAIGTIRRAGDRPDSAARTRVASAFRQLGVVAKRKYGYALAASWLSEVWLGEAGAELERDSAADWTKRAEALVSGYHQLAFAAIRLSVSAGEGDIGALLAKAERLNRDETAVKEQLWSLYAHGAGKENAGHVGID